MASVSLSRVSRDFRSSGGGACFTGTGAALSFLGTRSVGTGGATSFAGSWGPANRLWRRADLWKGSRTARPEGRSAAPQRSYSPSRRLGEARASSPYSSVGPEALPARARRTRPASRRSGATRPAARAPAQRNPPPEGRRGVRRCALQTSGPRRKAGKHDCAQGPRTYSIYESLVKRRARV